MAIFTENSQRRTSR